MSEPHDPWADIPLDSTEPPGDAAGNGQRSDDLNEAFKMGLRRAGLHWMRAGYELLAGVGALLDELNQRPEPDSTGSDPAERIELE